MPSAHIRTFTYSFAVDDHPGVTLIIIIWILHNLISNITWLAIQRHNVICTGFSTPHNGIPTQAILLKEYSNCTISSNQQSKSTMQNIQINQINHTKCNNNINTVMSNTCRKYPKKQRHAHNSKHIITHMYSKLDTSVNSWCPSSTNAFLKKARLWTYYTNVTTVDQVLLATQTRCPLNFIHFHL